MTAIDIRFKVSSKGAVSVYFPGRNLPVTLYADHWLAIAESIGRLRTFIAEHETELGAPEAV